MAKSKQQRRAREAGAPADSPAARPQHDGRERRPIRPDPPRPNGKLLVLAIVLFLAWLVYLIVVAWLASGAGGVF